MLILIVSPSLKAKSSFEAASVSDVSLAAYDASSVVIVASRFTRLQWKKSTKITPNEKDKKAVYIAFVTMVHIFISFLNVFQYLNAVG